MKYLIIIVAAVALASVLYVPEGVQTSARQHWSDWQKGREIERLNALQEKGVLVITNIDRL